MVSIIKNFIPLRLHCITCIFQFFKNSLTHEFVTCCFFCGRRNHVWNNGDFKQILQTITVVNNQKEMCGIHEKRKLQYHKEKEGIFKSQ